MCLAKQCCCGCSLRQGVIGIIIQDGILTLLAFVMALVMTMMIPQLDMSSKMQSIMTAIVWISFLLPTIRFVTGVVTACTGFSVRLLCIAFRCRAISDSTCLLLIFLVIALGTDHFTNIIIQIILLDIDIYYCVIMYSFYKEKESEKSDARDGKIVQNEEATKRVKVSGPSQVVLVQRQEEVSNQPMQAIIPNTK